MDASTVWSTTLATPAVLLVYEVARALAQSRRPHRWARSAHASLREAWFLAVSDQKGSEILAVQTLRNALMSATLTASTAMLGLIGTVSLAAPSLHTVFDDPLALRAVGPRLVLEVLLLALLFASLVCSAMAVRYYHHLGFIGGMPVESDARRRWSAPGARYIRRAGVLYGWGLRHLILVAPVLAALLHPWAGPISALLVVGVLIGFDRFVPSGSRDAG